MRLLEERIVQDGLVLGSGVLKVDTFLNHQIDPQLMEEMAIEWKKRLEGVPVTKIVTIESSGIAPALMLAKLYGVEMVFARKQKSITMDDSVYTADVYSFTKQVSRTITISKQFLSSDDHVVLVDDFLANGEAALGLCDVVEQAGASVSAIAIVIEKSFQPGRKKLDDRNYRVESLARIDTLEMDHIEFIHE
ncbi:MULTISPECIES: xanthine phosphoribosyltransferase [unclassified Geomicrobium]|uniref:xanthine phosphoribosyltransferase n=1 Tax=unclassified Geomicrobium TaxID=2628951 RepID=UPI00045ED1AB|nr:MULTISPECIES: xanthine phosphoribosyltransferase [unclassified Geomicrobium]GAJ98669.1 xanthine phosphoribosyltransferase [Geomicrobium sp. JCM 19055]GAK06577.1 xanthine phosphoribosyltransferase [Geomicrobium sp. JCM 19038]